MSEQMVSPGVRRCLGRTLYARGYLIGRSACPIALPPGWRTFEVGSGKNRLVVSHDDRVEAAVRGTGRFCLILGKCMDLSLKSMDLAAIADQVLARFGDEERLYEYFSELCGRFIILWGDDGSAWVVQDACGTRTCAYSKDYLSSHYGLINDIEKNARIDYWARYNELKDRPWSLPGNLTPYKGIFNLLPNHRLDLMTRTVERIYPRKARTPVSAEETAEYFAGILRVQAEVLARRYRLCMSLTAGNDSRVSLAALRDVREHAVFFTMKKADSDVYDNDFNVAKLLAERLGCEWRPIALKGGEGESIKADYLRNNYHWHNLNVIPHCMEMFSGPDDLHIRSNILEIVRKRAPIGQPTSGVRQTQAACFPADADDPFVRRAFDAFYAEQDLARIENLGYCLEDFLYWEYRLGIWNAGGCLLGTDMAFDTWCFFNQRKFLDMGLRMPQMFRKANFLVDRTIEKLWLEVAEPAPNEKPEAPLSRSWLAGMMHDHLRYVVCEAKYRKRTGEYVEIGWDSNRVGTGDRAYAKFAFAPTSSGLRFSFTATVFTASLETLAEYELEVSGGGHVARVSNLLKTGRNVSGMVLIPPTEPSRVAEVTFRLLSCGGEISREPAAVLRIANIVTERDVVESWQICCPEAI